jgi:uncharacterized membrane protein YgcG
MANNYDINYNDDRFTQVEADKKAALNEVDVTYGNMISQSDKYYKDQMDAAQDWADKQTQLQNEKTDFAIQEIEQQKAQAKKDYTKEQSGAYVDWQKQSNQYGANAEQVAAGGLQNTGYAESSQVSMYNAYQSRVVAARESYNLAVQNYNNSITEARLQNNSILAEIAYETLQKQLELSLQGFQYKNQLILDKANKKTQLESEYYARYQDVLKQINTENALAEEVRQYNESLALQKAQLEEEKRQFNEQMAYQKSKSSGSGGSGGSGGKIKDGGGSGGSGGSGGIGGSGGSGGGGKDEITGITNRHGDSWVEIPGHGRYSWAEVYAYVKDGTIRETVSNGKATYKWVGKKGNGKNVTPTVTGYNAKQKDLMRQAF